MAISCAIQAVECKIIVIIITLGLTLVTKVM